MNSPSQQDIWIGRRLGDRQRYRIEKRLGMGGMGDVFLAMDTMLSKHVALKLLKDTLVESEELRKRFEREVAVCAALKNDHIVDVSDYGVTTEGHPFYVMEYLPGQTLGQVLREQQRLSVERTVSIITQACNGLALAHRGVTLWRDGATSSEHVRIIHRDLKPDNIFLIPTGLGELVKILDFGIAKIRSEAAEYTTLTSMFIGTFHYAAPEQFEVIAELDGRADIYSLGIILYEMLSGTDPFGLGYNAQHMMISGMSWVLAHASKPPEPLRSQPGLSHLSPELEAVVMRCLQKLPDERFASVEELNQALQAAVAVEPLASGTTILLPPTPSQQDFAPKTNNRVPTHSRPEVSDQSLSPEQLSLLEILSEFVGPIAVIVLKKVLSQTSSTKELVERLALYLSEKQRVEFEQRLKSIQKTSPVQPQTSSSNSLSLNHPTIDANFIHQCERELLDLVGPVASILIKRSLRAHPHISPAELVNIIALEIPDPRKAEDFRQRLLGL